MIELVDEKFTSEQNLENHYNSHVVKRHEFTHMSKEEYEKLADELQRAKIDNKNIFGYIGMHNGQLAHCKYDKKNGYFVAYTMRGKEPYTITFYPIEYRVYMGRKAAYYEDEIPDGE